jgi:hypothetical protein
MTDNSKRTGAAIETHYQFLTWLVPAVEKFPKSQKFTLGDRIQATALDVADYRQAYALDAFKRLLY